METLEELLNWRPKGISPDYSKVFDKIAKMLFYSYRIKTDNDEFSFAEIEFYYYSSEFMHEDWNKITYPRKSEACTLFSHLSGTDICFNSHFDDEEACFGGILIRSLIDKEGNIIAGPMRCHDELYNSCKNSIPILVQRMGEGVDTTVNYTQRLRYGIPKKAQEPMPGLRYFLNREDWTRKINTFDTSKARQVTRKLYYGAIKHV